MKSPKTNLAQLLTEGRAKAGLTQRAVETATGISNAYLSQLESDKVQQPSPSILHKLAELYGIQYADVLVGAGYPVPKNSTSTEGTRFAARIGPTTPEEEDALADYLAFLRSKQQRRTGR